MFSRLFTALLEQSAYPAEHPTQVDRSCTGELPLLLLCYVQLCVKKNFAEKEQNVQLKKKKTLL